MSQSVTNYYRLYRYLLNVKCFRVQDLKCNAHLLWCNTDADVVLFSAVSVQALEQVSLVPLLLPEVKAKCTIILRHLDDVIYKREELDIVQNAQRENMWLIVSDLLIFPNAAKLKIYFSSTLSCFLKYISRRIYKNI